MTVRGRETTGTLLGTANLDKWTTAIRLRFPATAAFIRQSMTCSSGTNRYTPTGSSVSQPWQRHLRPAKWKKARQRTVLDGIWARTATTDMSGTQAIRQVSERLLNGGSKTGSQSSW